MTVLEKTLDTVHAKEPALQGPVADARAPLKDAKAKMELRRYQVDSTRAHDKLADALKTAEAACKRIWEAKVDEAVLQDAEKSVKALEPILAENKPFMKKDADYRDYDKKVSDRAKELTERIAGRRVQLAAGAGRNQLSDLVDKAKAALDTAEKPEATDAEVDAAQKTVDAIQPALDANAKLEKQDKGYAEKAERAREQQMQLMEHARLRQGRARAPQGARRGARRGQHRRRCGREGQGPERAEVAVRERDQALQVVRRRRREHGEPRSPRSRRWWCS